MLGWETLALDNLNFGMKFLLQLSKEELGMTTWAQIPQQVLNKRNFMISASAPVASMMLRWEFCVNNRTESQVTNCVSTRVEVVSKKMQS